MEKIRNLSYKDEKISRLLEEIVNIFRKDIKIPFRLYLFGSFATRRASYFSDLDIALETEKEITEKEIRKIKEELENLRTLRKIDFIYLNKASESIKNTVRKEGVLLYEFRG